MLEGGTQDNDKNLINSNSSMDKQINNNPDESISKKENNNLKDDNNIQSNNGKNELLGFESIELPDEEDFNDFRVIYSSEKMASKNNAKPNKSFKGKFDIMNLMIIKKSNKTKSKMPNIKSFFSEMLYHKIITKDKFGMETFKSPCYIYDSNIKEVLGDLNINDTNNLFLYMSYRSGFENLKNIGCGNYTSDCGWGCMMRCCQMMLSRGIIKIELSNLYNKKEIINSTDLKQLKKDVLYLFKDKYIPLEELENNIFLSDIYKKYQKNQDNYEVIPPYSIYILCKLGQCSGVYTSDMKMIKCFMEINEQVFNNSLGIAYFEGGIIFKKKLLEIFCTKRVIFNNKEDSKNIIITSLTKKKEVEDVEKDSDQNASIGAENIFEYYGEEHIFTKGGVIFVSLRLGLRDLDESYYNFIPLLFQKIHNNIGFVSGKKNKAFYFIGFNGDNKLIYADPHLNQKIEDNDITSYEIKDLYLLNVKELSSGITLGISINNSNDFKALVYDLDWFYKNYPSIITFK